MIWRVADMSATSRACRSRGIWNMTRATSMSLMLGVSARMLQGCYKAPFILEINFEINFEIYVNAFLAIEKILV